MLFPLKTMNNKCSGIDLSPVKNIFPYKTKAEKVLEKDYIFN